MHKLSGPSGGNLFRLLANCFLLFCSNLFIFPTLLAEIPSRHRVPNEWVLLYIARVHLFFYFTVQITMVNGMKIILLKNIEIKLKYFYTSFSFFSLAIYLGSVLVPSLQIVIQLPSTYEKQHCKGEPYWFSI